MSVYNSKQHMYSDTDNLSDLFENVVPQLLSLQHEQHKALEDYYKHRGLAGRKFLNALRQQSVANSNQIKKLTEKFEVTVKEMHEFLQSSSATAQKKPKSEKTSGRKVHFNSQLLVSTLD